MAGRYKVAPKESRTCDGIVFASLHEMQQYQSLRALAQCGAIAKLELQVPFLLLASDTRTATPVAKYIADFVVTEKDGTRRIYEAKGHVNAIYRLKRKWFHACYPHLRIVEI